MTLKNSLRANSSRSYGALAETNCLRILANKPIQSQVGRCVDALTTNDRTTLLSLDNPIPTPSKKTRTVVRIFGSNHWWLKGKESTWYPYDKYFTLLRDFKDKQHRIFGLWVNLITSKEVDDLRNRWNIGDASIVRDFADPSRNHEVTHQSIAKGPADQEWELPLWLKAQSYKMRCYDNPFLEGTGVEVGEAELEMQFHSQTSSRAPIRFLVVETVKTFLPKVVY